MRERKRRRNMMGEMGKYIYYIYIFFYLFFHHLLCLVSCSMVARRTEGEGDLVEDGGG